MHEHKAEAILWNLIFFTDELLLDTESRMWDVSEWMGGCMNPFLVFGGNMLILYNSTNLFRNSFLNINAEIFKDKSGFHDFLSSQSFLLFHIIYDLLIESIIRERCVLKFVSS